MDIPTSAVSVLWLLDADMISSGQIWALAIFAGVVLLLSIGMWPRAPRLRGQQKYARGAADQPDAGRTRDETIIGPFAILSAWITGASASDGSTTGGADSSDAGGGDSGGGGGK